VLRDDGGETIVELAGQTMSERASVAVAHGEDAVSIEAELGFEVIEHGLDEADVVVTAAGLTGVARSALGRARVVVFPLRIHAKRAFRPRRGIAALIVPGLDFSPPFSVVETGIKARGLGVDRDIPVGVGVVAES